jgi:acetyl-CoA acyltransferase 1
MLLLPLFKKVTQIINPALVEDITIGNVLQIGSGVAQIRMASLMAGFPDTTTAISVNRLCSSGLEAVSQVANKIQAGVIDIGLAGGVESMSLYDMMSMIEVEKISE